MNGYDSVFALANDKELEFDAMFDQDEELVDIVCGYNENGDPLTGADACPAATAEDRSCDDCNPDYDKDIDASDSKDAPKDAEGTVGYEFEEKPEVEKLDDNSKVDDDVKAEEDPEYQDKEDSDKGVEDTVTGTIENDKDIMETYFEEAEKELGYEEVESEEDRLLDAPLITPDDLEDTAKKVAEATDELNGQDTNPEVNAKERSCDDCDVDYDIKIDAKDSKDAPKDAEGTVGYDFEEKPEIGSEDDNSKIDDDVKAEEDPEYQDKEDSDKGVEDTVTGTIENDKDVLEAYFREAEDELNGQDTDPAKNACHRSCDNCDPDYDKDIDAKDSKDAPNDAEGTEGYDFEDKPEVGSEDDQSIVDPKEVKVEEEVDFDIPQDADGTVKTVPAGPTDIPAPTNPEDEKCCEEVDFDFNEAADVDVDKDVEELEDAEEIVNDDVLDDVETKEEDPGLEYDISDEELIDAVINDK